MTQEKANKYFNSDLGMQLNVLFNTSDGRMFIRHEEALRHIYGKLDKNTKPLENKIITEWYPDF
jgi:hypothetical protein